MNIFGFSSVYFSIIITHAEPNNQVVWGGTLIIFNYNHIHDLYGIHSFFVVYMGKVPFTICLNFFCSLFLSLTFNIFTCLLSSKTLFHFLFLVDSPFTL